MYSAIKYWNRLINTSCRSESSYLCLVVQTKIFMVVGGCGIAIIVTSSRFQETLRVEPCVEVELSLRESDLEPSLLIIMPSTLFQCQVQVLAVVITSGSANVHICISQTEVISVLVTLVLNNYQIQNTEGLKEKNHSWKKRYESE